MPRKPTSLALMIFIALSLSVVNPVAAQKLIHDWDGWDVIPGKVIIKYSPEKSANIKAGRTTSNMARLSVKHIEEHSRSKLQAMAPDRGFISILPDTFVGTFDPSHREEVLKPLASDPDVLYFEPDRIRKIGLHWGTATPDDSNLSNLWGMDRIGAPIAWQKQSAQRSSIRAAVWEGQYDDTHRDLTAQNSPIQNNSGEISEHATFVSGIVAATGNNSFDVVGVANVELVSLGDTDTASGFVDLISWAMNNQVNVINMSWGYCVPDHCGECLYTEPSATEQDAILNASSHIVFVCSAGNDGCNQDVEGRTPVPVSYVGVIGVSALDQNDDLAGFSNYGSYVDLTAPGVNILSTIPGNTVDSANGTSASAPFVAGVAATILAVKPSFHVASIAHLLYLTAEDLGTSGRDDDFGHGVVRADRAVIGIADVYAESGVTCGSGTLLSPYCTLDEALTNVPEGGTVGLLKNSSFNGPRTITKACSIVPVGGVATIGL